MQSSKEYSLVGLLVESGEPKDFESLQIVHNTQAEVDAKGVVEMTLTMIQHQQLFTDTPVKVLVKRISTPERIRRLTEKLSGDIHELMERHDVRKNRQHVIKIPKSGVIGKNQQTPRSRLKKSEITTPRLKRMGKEILPNIYEFFQNARSQHLIEARQNKVMFPQIEKPNGYSSKDPDGFSMRFSTETIKHSKQARN